MLKAEHIQIRVHLNKKLQIVTVVNSVVKFPTL
jgi:hypothetical protein